MNILIFPNDPYLIIIRQKNKCSFENRHENINIFDKLNYIIGYLNVGKFFYILK